MFRLKTWVDKDGELTLKGRKLSRVLVYTYLLCLVLLCWTPQYGLVEGVDTPGIQHFGRVVVLLTPFNSLTNFYQLDSLKEIVFVLGQNVTNIFLLSPLILGLLDDLWTNTLGGLLALAAYRLLVKLIQTHFKE